MEKYRRFCAASEDAALLWTNTVVSDIQWEVDGERGNTESKPFDVKCDLMRGKAKPGIKKNDNRPRAAQEKLASDLAFHLGLPVPPVVLWDRGCEIPDDAERFACVSAWAFRQTDEWQKEVVQKAITEEDKDSAKEPSSAILAFDAWISAGDRKQDHVLVDLESEKGCLGLAFIDYAFSFTETWKDSIQYPFNPPSNSLPVGINYGAVRDVAMKINKVPDALIGEIVNRIPASFLPDEKKTVIEWNLIDRKVRMEEFIKGLPEG